MMDQETFYSNLLQALIQSNFRFNAQTVTPSELRQEHDKLSAALRFVLDYHLLDLLGVDTPDFDLDPAFDPQGVQVLLNEIRDYAALVGFKYLLGQPVVVAVIDADTYKVDELITFADRFDQAIVAMLAFGGKMGRAQLSSTGIILYTFFDHAAAGVFTETTQAKCKRWHFWKKTFVIPWMIDVSAKMIRRHSGLPLITSPLLDADKISRSVFSR